MWKSYFFKAVGSILLSLAAATGLAKEVTIGSKDFTEQLLVAEMTAQLLKAHDFKVDKRTGLGSVILRKAQENGQIDLYWEYTGTSLIVYNKIKEPMSAQETYQTVKELDAQKGLIWLQPSGVNNTHAFAMNRDAAKAHDLKTMSDLAEAMEAGEEFILACGPEFIERSDGLRPLQEAYGFDFKRPDIKRMDPGLVYQALKERQVDIGLVYTTDGRIPAFDFVLLEDDKDYFPAYALAPVVRMPVLEANPELETLLNELSSRLDEEIMARLNGEVDVNRRSIREVAEEFLKSQDLL